MLVPLLTQGLLRQLQKSLITGVTELYSPDLATISARCWSRYA